MELTLLPWIDDQKCFETVRRLRWPGGVACPDCESMAVTKSKPVVFMESVFRSATQWGEPDSYGVP